MTDSGPDQAVRPRAMPSDPLRLALVDQDSGFLKVLRKRLDHLGWEYHVADGPLPLEALVDLRLSAVVVDLACLGSHGWDWLASVCAQMPGVGIVVCSGESTVPQRVRALRLGADDWISKPCHPEEVIARVEAVARRRRRGQAPHRTAVISAGELEIRADQFQAFVGERSVELTRREFELLEMLASAEGRVLDRDLIYQEVWGYAMARGDRSVDVFVRKLRQKLEKASPGWRYIHTHFAVGYRFGPEPRVEGSTLRGHEPARGSVADEPDAADKSASSPV